MGGIDFNGWIWDNHHVFGEREGKGSLLRIAHADGSVRRQSGKWTAFFAAVVFSVGVLPFLRAILYGLVNLDDYWYVATHDEITAGVGWSGIRFAFTCLEESIWMPLTWLSYMIDHSLAKVLEAMAGLCADAAHERVATGIMHAHSILIHGLNAVLVWRLLCRVAVFVARQEPSGGLQAGRPDGAEARLEAAPCRAGAMWVCALAALLWAVHPLRCESVAFIASRKDVLSMFWMLAAMLFWLKRERGNGPRMYAISIACFVLAAMAKPSVMTFPALCFLLDFFVRRRVRPLDYVPPLALAAALGAFAGHAQAAGGATVDFLGVPYWYRLVNAAVSFGLYIWNTICPTALAPQCIIKWPEWPRLCVPGLAMCAVAGGWLAHRALCYWRQRESLVTVEWRGLTPLWSFTGDRAPAFAGFAWFAVSVAPMLGIVGFGYHAMADRFTYIPAIGLSIAAVAAWARWDVARRSREGEPIPGRSGRCGIAAASVMAAAVVLYGAFAWRQTGYWRDDGTLFSRTIEVDGDGNAAAHGILANWCFEFPHDLEKCVAHFEKASKSGLWYIEASFEVYIFALCELGREREVPALLKKYDEWVLGIERDSRWGKGSGRAKFMRGIYQFSRVAYLVTQPELRRAAEEELAEAKCPEGEPVLFYLKWRLALAHGDVKAAEEAKRNLVWKSRRKGYTRFRYLRGKEG